MLTTALILAVGMVQQDWYTFAPEGKNFLVVLPSQPNSTTSRALTNAAGPAQLTAAQLKTSDALYSIQVTESRGRVDPKTLDEGIRQFAEGKQGVLGAVEPITVDGNPGRDFQMTERSDQGQVRSKMRWVVSGNALFMLAAAGRPGANVPANADRFLGSLAIGSARVANIVRGKAEVADAGKAQTKVADAGKAQTEVADAGKAKADAADADQAPVKGADPGAAMVKEADPGELTVDGADPGEAATVKGADGGEAKSNPASGSPGKATTPKAAPSRVTITRIPRDAKSYFLGDLVDLSRSYAAKERDGFRDVGPAGSVLVGVRVSYIERFGGPKVRSAQPIYRSGNNHYAGQIHGNVVAPVWTVVARPGYAVGGLVTHTGLTLDGFGIVFMKVDGDRLDPTDTYNSPWIGDKKGGGPGEVMSNGALVVGLQGKSGSEVNALGLTALK